MNEPAISIQNLSKTYQLFNSHLDRVKEAFNPLRKKYHRDHHALDDISIDIKKGEFYGIIGRNGSGKSTLLQLIAGILQPTNGTIAVNGSIAALLELGAGFNPEFTGRQNVFLNAALLGVSNEETEKRFDDIASFADIGDFIDQPVKTYSSGMYIRLAFAVAISVQPEILIVDEALAVGDMFFQQKCIQYMEENMKGCTKLLVSHDMHSVVNLCERVGVLHQGKLVMEGLPIECAEYYTKTLHNELYRDTNSSPTTGKSPGETSTSDTTPEPSGDWVKVPVDSTGGAAQLVITHVKLLSDKNVPVTTSLPGDQLKIEMLIKANEKIVDPIFGYIIKDRVGNGICGDNSLSLTTEPAPLEKGTHKISLNFSWPDIYPADYVITLGVGNGNHPLYHTIQCWAHNILMIKGLNPGNNVHGIFTNKLSSFNITEIS